MTADEPRYAIPDQVFRRRVNVSAKGRALSALGGGLLLLFGLGRRGASRLALAALGGALVARGATGRCRLYRSLGVDTTRRRGTRSVLERARVAPSGSTRGAPGVIRVQHSITLLRPRAEVYAFLRDLSNLPRFMEGVRAVEALGACRYRFILEEAFGKTASREVIVVEDVEDKQIMWRSTPFERAAYSGAAYLATAPGGRGTEVTIVLDFDPVGGPFSRIAAVLRGGGPKMALRGDLRRLRQLLDAGEIPTTVGQPHGRRAWK